MRFGLILASLLARRIAAIEMLVIDVDGVLTDGTFDYTAEGKVSKRFGPDDADALKLLSEYVQVTVVTADSRGFDISRARVNDMGFQLHLVPAAERLDWIAQNHALAGCGYMGDSFLDAEILDEVGVGFAPKNAHPRAKKSASFVTRKAGGHGAVAEACGLIARGKRLPIKSLF